mmetsp:Transcript_64251/g.193928  ORF Transcript_64251/g.193928 Transcript_64251/m.193928 type:complete len:340 (+) Transcript_64251:236-1255(+)
MKPSGVDLAPSLHGLVQAVVVEVGRVQSVLEVFLAQRLNMGSGQSATLGVVVRLETLVAALREGGPNDGALFQHLLLVLVQPGVPLDRVVQVLGFARVGITQAVGDIIQAGQGGVVAALEGDGLGLWVVGHLDVEDKGNLARNLGGLAHDHQAIALERAALDAEAAARLHLPEEADLTVLLRQDPDAEQVAAGHEGLVEVVPGLPGALGAGKLGDGGVDGAHVTELVDPQVHAAGLVVVCVRNNLVGLSSAEHAGFDGLFDERSLAAGDGDPTAMEGVGLGHIAWLREASGPRQRAAGKLERLVAVVEALAHGHLLLGQLRAGLLEIVECVRGVDVRLH